MASKYEDAKSKAQGVKDSPFVDTVLKPFSWRDFQDAVGSGAVLGEKFLEMEPGTEFSAFFMGTSQGFLEEKEGPKPVTKMHWELAVVERGSKGEFIFRGTSIRFSILEFAQLKNQISDIAPQDGSWVFMVAMVEMGEAKRSKRKMWNFVTAAFAAVREPRLRIAAKAESGIPEQKA